ncbi:MAG: hypothetical protein KF778_10270 [Rhodocyclaceae bacterium]|nr:hypothetical protein [Rhodocyclaceae bacterium]MBX3668775.1 hypothetical protein [Rhodocyclaceae bacterium]
MHGDTAEETQATRLTQLQAPIAQTKLYAFAALSLIPPVGIGIEVDAGWDPRPSARRSGKSIPRLDKSLRFQSANDENAINPPRLRCVVLVQLYCSVLEPISLSWQRRQTLNTFITSSPR